MLTIREVIKTFYNALLQRLKKYRGNWEQNDPTADDYIKNRPFYTGDPVETVLVEESTVTFVENNGFYMAKFLSTFEATIGDTYKVFWDGVVYERTCVDFEGSLIIGNLSILGGSSDTGEPFIMEVVNGGIMIATKDTSASHTFSISGLVQEVVKLDKKYIPELNYSASQITSGTLPIIRGGTGYSSIADTAYTTARYRASSLHSSETNPKTNGTICWTYK